MTAGMAGPLSLSTPCTVYVGAFEATGYFTARSVCALTDRSTCRSCGYRVSSPGGNTLFECDGYMPPDLDRKHNRRCEQQRSHGYMSNRGHYHGQFWLNHIVSPGHAGKKCKKSKT